MKKGICVHHLTDMIPCTGKHCDDCEKSPAYAKGYNKGCKEANARLNGLMKSISECVYQEGYDKGFEAGKAQMAAGAWTNCEDALPEDDKEVLVIINGHREHTRFTNAIELAMYSKDEGWILEHYPIDADIVISQWADINIP